VEYAVVSARGDVLEADDLPIEPPSFGANLDSNSNLLGGAASASVAANFDQAVPKLIQDLEKAYREGQIEELQFQRFVADLIRIWSRKKLGEESDGQLYAEFLSWVEQPLIRQTVESCDGQALAAAKKLGIHRTTVKKKLEQGNG